MISTKPKISHTFLGTYESTTLYKSISHKKAAGLANNIPQIFYAGYL